MYWWEEVHGATQDFDFICCYSCYSDAINTGGLLAFRRPPTTKRRRHAYAHAFAGLSIKTSMMQWISSDHESDHVTCYMKMIVHKNHIPIFKKNFIWIKTKFESPKSKKFVFGIPTWLITENVRNELPILKHPKNGNTKMAFHMDFNMAQHNFYWRQRCPTKFATIILNVEIFNVF